MDVGPNEATGVTAYKPVLSLIRPHHRQIFSLTLQVGQGAARHRIAFKVTDDHPWRTLAGQWVQTVALTPRDQIIRAQGPPARVISVRRTARFESTYNLEVADFHTYFVGRDQLWVHNACDPTELHHITPKYLGGGKNGPLAAIPRSLHQQITNAFRRLAPYGKGPRSPEEVEEIMRKVYEQHPLP